MPGPILPGTWTTAAAALLLSAGAQALPGDASRLQQEADRLFQQQEQQQKARDRRLAPDVPDIRLPEASAPHARLTFPVEQPCFRVKKSA